MNELVAKRLWAHVVQSPNSECWIFTGPTIDRDGYGRFGVDGLLYAAHRVAYMDAYGVDLSSRELVLHHCDNPPCVRPDHLFVGDHGVNVRDRVAKARSAVGSCNGRAKLDEEDVLDIRLMLSTKKFSHRDIAGVFGVDHKIVGLIARGKIWQHVA